jgi:hypothetical protein
MVRINEKPGARPGLFDVDVRHSHPNPLRLVRKGTMAGSDFRRDLAEDFRKPDPIKSLRADWHYNVKTDELTPEVADWRLSPPVWNPLSMISLLSRAGEGQRFILRWSLLLAGSIPSLNGRVVDQIVQEEG